MRTAQMTLVMVGAYLLLHELYAQSFNMGASLIDQLDCKIVLDCQQSLHLQMASNKSHADHRLARLPTS
jgi:hypothetical protein